MISWKRSLNQLWFLARGMVPTNFFLLLVGLGVFVVSLGAMFQWGWLFFILYNGWLGMLMLLEIYFFQQFPVIKARREFETLFELQKKIE